MNPQREAADLLVLFVLYESFDSNSAIHVHYLATHLSALGCDCFVASPRAPLHLAGLEPGPYRTFQFSQVSELRSAIGRESGPDIIHAWTPRQNVIRFVSQLPPTWQMRMVVHLEDDEAALFRRMYPNPFVRLIRRSVLRVPPTVSQPSRARRFIAGADGITIIVHALQEVIPDSKPVRLLEPGVDFGLFHPMPCAQSLDPGGSDDGRFKLGYMGNVHKANRGDVAVIYQAASRLNQEGIRTTILRTGRNLTPLPSDDFDFQQFETVLGYVDYADLPKIMACADLLVQPGGPGPFDARRLPSKLPEYLAMGKPVILPAVNLGRELTDMQNAFVFPKVGVEEIMRTVKEIIDHPGQAERIGHAASTFARRRFNWGRTARQALGFYQSLLKNAQS